MMDWAVLLPRLLHLNCFAGKQRMTGSTDKPRNLRGDILFAFAVAAACYVAWLVRGVLVMLFVSALFAVVLAPLVRATEQLHIGQWVPFKGSVAIFVLLLVAAGGLTAFGFLAIPPVIQDLKRAGGSEPAKVPELLAKLNQLPFLGNLDTDDIFASQAATHVLGSITGLAGSLMDILSGLVLTIYFILEGDHAYRWTLSFFSPQRRQRLDDALQRASVRMGRWLIGQASLMLVLGISSTVFFALMHIRYAYALGVLTGLLNIVPVLGAAISLVLAMLVAATDSWARMLSVVVFFFVYLQVENSFLSPRIMKTRVDLPALAIVVSLLLGFSLAGILGATVAIPTAVLVSVLLDEYFVHKEEKPELIEKA
jgi:predicted PurR-regulated permease PerM